VGTRGAMAGGILHRASEGAKREGGGAPVSGEEAGRCGLSPNQGTRDDAESRARACDRRGGELKAVGGACAAGGGHEPKKHHDARPPAAHSPARAVSRRAVGEEGGRAASCSPRAGHHWGVSPGGIAQADDRAAAAVAAKKAGNAKRGHSWGHSAPTVWVGGGFVAHAATFACRSRSCAAG